MGEDLRQSDVSRQAEELQRYRVAVGQSNRTLKHLNELVAELRAELKDVRGDLAEAIDIFHDVTALTGGVSGFSDREDEVIERLLDKHWPVTKEKGDESAR